MPRDVGRNCVCWPGSAGRRGCRPHELPLQNAVQRPRDADRRSRRFLRFGVRERLPPRAMTLRPRTASIATCMGRLLHHADYVSLSVKEPCIDGQTFLAQRMHFHRARAGNAKRRHRGGPRLARSGGRLRVDGMATRPNVAQASSHRARRATIRDCAVAAHSRLERGIAGLPDEDSVVGRRPAREHPASRVERRSSARLTAASSDPLARRR